MTTPRIVLADDGSPGADLAWAWVWGQRWPDWDLTVLRADPPGFGEPLAPGEAGPSPDDRIDRSEFAATRRGAAGFASVEFLKVRADPRAALVDVTAEVVVIGPASQGRTPYHLGSTTEWLLHAPPTPVVVARLGGPVRRVLVSTDGSAHALLATRAAAGLPWLADTEVSVLSVDDGRTDTGAALAEAAEIVGPVTSQLATVRRRGDPRSSILAEAGEVGADLIVAGTRGLTVLRRLVLGSTAGALARNANCSVLVAHSHEQ